MHRIEKFVGLVMVAAGLIGCTVQTYDQQDYGLVLAESGDFFQQDSYSPAGLTDGTTGFQIQGYEQQSTLSVTTQFEALGFDSVHLFGLAPTYPVDASTFALRLPPMTFMVFREGGWNRGNLLETVRDLPARYAACGIGLSDILVVETSLATGRSAVAGGLNFDNLAVDDYNRLGPLIERLPVRRKPLFFFVGSIHSEQLNQSVGGFAANVFSEFGSASLPQFGSRSPIAQTGAVARRPLNGKHDYQFDQTISHEIAHLLGLQHERSSDQPDIMAPLTCKDCNFTARQCATMRESAMLVRGGV